MKAWAYYNEFEPYCVAWLRSLIKEGLIPDGEVDDRSIRESLKRGKTCILCSSPVKGLG